MTKTRSYYRLSVKDFVEAWVGWTPITSLAEIAGERFGEREEAFFSTLFLTGGRVSEVLNLRRSNFEARREEGLIVVRNMLLLKRYKKLRQYEAADGEKTAKKWVTQRLQKTRKPFPIQMQEPLTPKLLGWIEKSANLLFPSPYKTDRPLSRFWAYKTVRKLDESLSSDLKESLGLNKPFVVDGRQVGDALHLWLHWFRSQRASQLVNDYGFEVVDLIDYFSWEHYGTALTYARRGWRGLASKMQPTAYYV